MVAIPPYFPPSRYETTGDLLVDHENQKILSLPTAVDRHVYDHSQINHLFVRSVKDQMITKAENALIGKANQNTDSSGVHPGILYGGPAGGILAPMGLYFYKLFRKRCRKKKKKKQEARNDSDDEDGEEENNEETLGDDITTAVTTQISNASSSVVNHIKGKISSASTSLVDDLKTQAIAQEEEILENIKSTILEQETEMVEDIKKKFAKTERNLIKDIRSKFSMFKKSAASKNQTFQEKRKEEEALCKLSDSEEELVNTVKRRISIGQDALISEIEKSIDATNENIIRKIDTQVPKAKGKALDSIKVRMKERGRSLFNDIKSILTCTEKKIIDDVKSHIEEVKSTKMVQESETNYEKIDEIRVEIVDPNQSAKEISDEKADTACSLLQNEDTVEILQPEMNKENHEKSKISIETQKKHPEDTDINLENEKQDQPKVTKEIEEDIQTITEYNTTENKNEISEEPIDGNSFAKIKHKIAEIPSHFLKHFPKITGNSPETGSRIEEPTIREANEPICKPSLRKTSPIPIPCVHQAKLNHPIAQKNVADENLQSSTTSGSEENEEETSTFLEKMKHSVSHLPFTLNFSGIPEKVKSFMEQKKAEPEAELEEVKIEEGKTVSSGANPPQSQVEFETQETNIRNEENDTSEHVRRTWIVLECYDEDWPSHLPRNRSVRESNETQQSDVPSSSGKRWLHLEDVNTSWPKHLPKNHHGNCSTGILKQGSPRQNNRKHQRKNKENDEDSEENDDNWKERLPKNLLKPRNTEDERKGSNVSSTSEFSTTSSVETTSTDTLESRDSLSGSKLPNFDDRLKRKQKRSARLKSLDSGIHHYYGEYISIEFLNERTENENGDLAKERKEKNDNTPRSEGSGSSENSQEDSNSTINRSDEDAERRTTPEEASGEILEGGGGYYDGFVVSLGNRKFDNFPVGHQDDNA